jgi:hypothetical protein
MKKTIRGRVNRDPEIRYTADGHASTNFTLQTADGETVSIICHGELAENVVLSLDVGAEIVVECDEPQAFVASGISIDLRNQVANITDDKFGWIKTD